MAQQHQRASGGAEGSMEEVVFAMGLEGVGHLGDRSRGRPPTHIGRAGSADRLSTARLARPQWF